MHALNTPFLGLVMRFTELLPEPKQFVRVLHAACLERVHALDRKLFRLLRRLLPVRGDDGPGVGILGGGFGAALKRKRRVCLCRTLPCEHLERARVAPQFFLRVCTCANASVMVRI